MGIVRTVRFCAAVILCVAWCVGLSSRGSAQPPSASTVWWPAPAIERALSCIRLTPADLRLRDDYVDRDSCRLPVVDGLMRHPEQMSLLLTLSSGIAWDVDTVAAMSPGAIPGAALVARMGDLALVSELPVALSPAPSRSDTAPVGNGEGRHSDWRGFDPEWRACLARLATALADTGWIDSTLGGLSPADRAFVLELAREFVLEDADDRNKSPEILDSLQKLEDRYAQRFASLSDALKWRWVLTHGGATVATLLRALPAAPPPENRLPAGAVRVIATPGGDIVFGTRGADHFTGDPILIIDPDGDDRYELTPLRPGRNRCILDYGGDDEYVARDGNGLGAALFGWSLLVDFQGDDVYRAGSFSLGAGWFGVGGLYDLDGRDLYIGDIFTQGAGGFGIGVLYDAGAGSDQYVGRLFSQGFGFAAGVGVLADAGGNEVYTAGGKYGDVLRYRDHYLSLSQGFGYGIRPHFSGGVGLLLDREGNDVYVADIFGQGASYWWAFGGICDRAGNDQYIAYQYAQGSATHLTAGCLYDVAGHDRYESKGVSQGCGHDWASGVLLDGSGNDRYMATDLSQAAGSANGVGILIDGAGNDGYYSVSAGNTQGYGNPRRQYGSVGLFLDLGGEDRYDGRGEDSTLWLGPSRWGVGVDADSSWWRHPDDDPEKGDR